MQPPVKSIKFNFFYLSLAILGVILLRDLWVNYTEVEALPYSEFLALANEGAISEVTVSGEHLRGTFKRPSENGRLQFITTIVPSDLSAILEKSGISFKRVVDNTFLRDFLSWVVPALVFFGIWFLIMSRMGKGGVGGSLMSIGKNRAKVYVENDVEVGFDNVAGVEEAKEELAEIVNFLKDPEHFGRLGARSPKGVLLVGPPGTGKTLLAKAVAGEAKVPFFSINGSEFVEMFVGVGAARVRDLFEQARQKSPCIIFIDELDALGRSRVNGLGGGNDEKEHTLNQLLVELDGFGSESGIVLLAATNRPEILDPALLRSGRFDRQVLVDRPDKEGRLAILKVHTKKLKLAAKVSMEEVAALTTGFTGADLENLANESALAATRRGGESITLADFSTAIERIIAGLEKKNRLLNDREREIVAHHEMGHAIVAATLPGTDPVHKVSIIPRGIGALGYTIQRPLEDRFLMTKEELENKMAILLGGRAAEQLIFNHLSTGAADDLNKATDIAREMVTKYGMDAELGSVAYDESKPSLLGTGKEDGRKNYSEDAARSIDRAVKELVSRALSRSLRILRENLPVLKESSVSLLKKETLGQMDLEHLFGNIVNPEVVI